MTDLVIALVGAITIGALVSNKKIQENFGLIPSMTVNVQKEYAIQPKGKGKGSAALGENVYSGPMMAVPPGYQAALAPRSNGFQPLGALIQYNLPPSEYLAGPDNPLTYGPPESDRMSAAGVPSCASQGKLVENYDDPEKYEAISQSAPKAFERAQALADMGVVKAEYQPFEKMQGPASVVVYDRLMYSNTKSALYGQGDPIRGDIGCIVPIRDGWFRPSVVPNRDLRPGALSILGGIENDTNRQLRALQDVYSDGVSRQTSDAYAYTVNPALAQKSLNLQGPQGAQQDIVATASP
jgi:hypothetical protein